MELIDKKKYISQYLFEANELIIDELYELLQSRLSMKKEYIQRAKQAEKDIEAGRLYSREEVEKMTT